MSSINRTLIFIGAAAVCLLLAVGVHYSNKPSSVEGFTDVGAEFFPEFTDPTRATELSVIKFDSESKEPQSFSVKKNDDGRWVIPSHHDYPAEAAARLAKTATSMMGIRKVAIQTRSKDDWARYGVADPEAENVVATDDAKTPRGTRLTLRDASGNALIDLIVGASVEGRENSYYVREPEKNPVYVAQMTVDLSTKFADWIEPDLLKVNQPDVNKVIVDRYSVDEQQGAIVQGDRLEFDKDKTSSKWLLTGLDEATEKTKESAVTDIVSNLDQLKIVGVRPKPEGLNADLTLSPEVAQNPLIAQILRQDMQRQGFFIARGPEGQQKLVSNEGELIAGTSNGVRYTLYFGEIARGTAKDIEIGLNEKTDAPAEEKKEGDAAGTPAEDPAKERPDFDDKEKEGPRRYLLVKVDYDESLLGPKPEEPVAPEKPAILNEAAPPAEPGTEAPKADAPVTPDNANATPEAAQPEAAPAAAAAPEANAAPGDAAPDTPDAPKADPGCDEQPAAAVPPQEPAPQEPAPQEAAPQEAAPQEAAPQEAAPQEAAPQEAAPQATPADAPVDPAAAKPEAAAPVQEGAAPAAGQDAGTQPPAAPVDPRAEAQKQYDLALGNYEAAKAAHKDAVKQWEERAKEGKKRVKELSARFGAWYYVISAESFEKFQLNRAGAVEPKDAAVTPAPPGAGGPLPPINLPGLSPM